MWLMWLLTNIERLEIKKNSYKTSINLFAKSSPILSLIQLYNKWSVKSEYSLIEIVLYLIWLTIINSSINYEQVNRAKSVPDYHYC
jgi:hypothetical protein